MQRSPREIMDLFTDNLAGEGWEIVEEVRSTGTDSFAAAWVRGDDRLRDHGRDRLERSRRRGTRRSPHSPDPRPQAHSPQKRFAP